MARVKTLNAAGEYAESFDLLDDPTLKKTALSDAAVKKAYLETYDAYTNDLIQKGDFTEAVRVLENKTDVDPVHTADIKRQIVDTYILRIERDRSKRFFKEALDTINFTLPKYATYDTKNRIGREKEVILDALSRDTGVDGRNALLEAIDDVCANNHVTKTDYLPYMGTDTSHKKVVECSHRYGLDAGMAPETLSQMAYILYFWESEKKLAPCVYLGKWPLIHIKVDWTVGLIDIRTGNLAYQREFDAQVSECPATRNMSITHGNLEDRPVRAEVDEYLRSVLK
jgi:hypothetical protein